MLVGRSLLSIETANRLGIAVALALQRVGSNFKDIGYECQPKAKVALGLKDIDVTFYAINSKDFPTLIGTQERRPALLQY